ncbi:MAG: Beta sliding clamp [Parcubacteria group bacterium]|nr:Beta sliding clamp [Parcubacteria group bacterium]
MKIECIKERLSESVSKAEKIAGKNPTLPVLAGLFLEAKDNTLTIRATNLDLGISTTVPAKVIEPGQVVVPAQILSSFLNSLSKEKSITLELVDQVLKVVTSNTETSIKTLNLEDFPIVPTIADDEGFSLPAKDLVNGLKSVHYAAAVGSMKPELSSIFINYEGENLVFAATDSFRLAEKKIKVKKIPHFKYILIPQKNAGEIIRIFDSVDDDISISIHDNQIALTGGGIYLVSRIIDGVFPDYRQIIPKETTSKVVVLKQDLVTSLKTSLIFSDTFNQLHLTVSPLKKKFEIETKNSNIGQNTYAIQAAIEGEELEINVNHKYFTDCFQSIPADSVDVKFAGQARPIVIDGVGDKTFMYLVMPMNRS